MTYNEYALFLMKVAKVQDVAGNIEFYEILFGKKRANELFNIYISDCERCFFKLLDYMSFSELNELVSCIDILD